MKLAKTLRIIGITAVLSLLMAAIPATPALASYDIDVSPEEGAIGDEITITGANFYFSETTDRWVTIFFSPDEAVKGNNIGTEVTTYEIVDDAVEIVEDDNGSFETTFDMPEVLNDGGDDEYVEPGTYYIYVTLTSGAMTETSTYIRAYQEFTVTVGGETAVTVSINAPESVPPGSNFTAEIDINLVENFDATNYDVSFDASILRLDNVTSGDLGGTVIPVDIFNEVSPGRFTVVQNVPGLSGVTSAGYLAVLHFHVIGSSGNNVKISLSNGILGNNMAEEIATTWVDDLVHIYSPVPGDANEDGVVDFSDLAKEVRIILGLDPKTNGADANQDDKVDVLDLVEIKLIIIGP
jgi:hypothetical protein